VSRASAQPTSAFDWGIDEDNVLQVPGYLSVLANDEDIDFGGNPTSAAVDEHACAALAAGETEGGLRAFVSGAIQVVSGRGGRAFLQRGSVCRTHRPTGQPGRAGRRLAVGQFVAASAKGNFALAQRLARATAPQLAAVGQPATNRGRSRRGPAQPATEQPLRQRRVDREHRHRSRLTIDASPPGPTKAGRTGAGNEATQAV
jgi:hypothetical protein